MTVFTRKFSEFVGQNVDEVVGLTGGANSIGPNSGGGGGGAVTKIITQPGNVLEPKQWVTINTLGHYVLAQADNAQDAEVAGVVISTDPLTSTFTVQQAGPLDGLFTGLLPGTPYFLDPNVPGNMLPMDVSAGQVSKPLFYADSDTGGWVTCLERGIILGGIGPNTGGGGGGTDTSKVPVNQTGWGVNLSVGDAIRVSTPAAGHPVYVRAQADTFANSLAVGFIIQSIDANNFIYQTSGYVAETATVFPPLTDDTGAPLVASTLYYLSSTVAGKLTSVEPASPNFSRPMYIPEQTIATTGLNAGIILEERSLMIGSTPPPPTPTIVQTTSPLPFVTTATGWVDTGICASIEITNPAQRVLIMGNINLASDGSNGVAFRLARNGIPIDIGNAAGTRTQASGSSFGQPAQLDSGIDCAQFYVDSPGVVGTYTYCFEVFRGNSATVSVNAGVNDGNASNFYRTGSSLILMII